MVDELGNSAVAYSPIVVDTYSKNKLFTPTFYEWLNEKGQQINRRGSSGAISGTTIYHIYNVPIGYTLFIVSYTISGYCGGAVDDLFLLGVDGTLSNSNSCVLAKCPLNTTINFSGSFNYPIRCKNYVWVGINNPTHNKVYVNFTGILIKNDSIPLI